MGDVWTYLDALDELVGESTEDQEVNATSEILDKSTPPAILPGVDERLWRHVADAVEAGRWDQVAREAAVFFEDHLRQWAGLTFNEVGVDLVKAALHPTSGKMSLARGGHSTESEGWHLIARGIVLAVRNVTGHRLHVFKTEQAAMGVVGAVSLLLGQIQQDYPTPVMQSPG